MPIYGSSTLMEYLDPHPTRAHALLLRLEIDARVKRDLGEAADTAMARAQLEFVESKPGAERRARLARIAECRERCIVLQGAADLAWRIWDDAQKTMNAHGIRHSAGGKRHADAAIAAVLSHERADVREAAMLALG